MFTEKVRAIVKSMPLLHGLLLPGVMLFRRTKDRHCYNELQRFRRYCAYVPTVVAEPLFVIVGANDGITGDPCSDILFAGTAWRGLFIEPVPYCVDRLRATFQDARRFSIEQLAVGAPAGQATFYYVDDKARDSLPDLPPWFNQLGSFNRRHLVNHLNGSLTPFIVDCRVDVRPLADVLDSHGIRDVHLLQVDTEGHDYEVLRTLNFATHQPLAIFIEYTHLPRIQKRAMRRLLRSAGYAVHDCGGNYFALHTQSDRRLRTASGRNS